MKITWTVLVILLISLTLFPAQAAARVREEEVLIVDDGDLSSWGYSPRTLTVPVGTTVIWRNSGSQAHGITSRDQLFDSRLLDSGRSWSYTFEEPGTYHYFCVPHPWMKGTVIVTPAEEPTPRPTSTPRSTPAPATRADNDDREDNGNDNTDGGSPAPPAITPAG